MITKEQAIQLVEKHLRKMESTEKLIVYLEGIDEHHWGWVIGYNSEIYIETNNIDYALIGNAPFTVMKETGEIKMTPSYDPPVSLLKPDDL